MSLWKITLCVVLVVILKAQDGEAIDCYQCNSHNDSRCMWKELPDEMKKPCTPKDTMCRKIVQFIEFDSNGLPPDNRVIRSCGYDESNYKGRCYQRSGFGGRQEVCSCLQDNCNSSGRLQFTTSLLSGAVFVLLRYCKYN